MEFMEKCSACEGTGSTVKIKHYKINTDFSVKRKSVKVCAECDGTGLVPINNAQKEIQRVIKAH